MKREASTNSFRDKVLSVFCSTSLTPTTWPSTVPKSLYPVTNDVIFFIGQISGALAVKNDTAQQGSGVTCQDGNTTNAVVGSARISVIYVRSLARFGRATVKDLFKQIFYVSLLSTTINNIIIFCFALHSVGVSIRERALNLHSSESKQFFSPKLAASYLLFNLFVTE